MPRKPFQYKKPRKSLLNQDFGRWHVLSWDGCKPVTENGVTRTRSFWVCRCACGTEKSIQQAALLKPKGTRSCGCAKSDKLRADTGILHRAWKGHGGISGTLWYSIQKDALRRKIPFEIGIEYAWTVFTKQKAKCCLTGLSLTMTGESKGRGTASLDRIDNTLGYVEGNVQWLHKDINRMKHVHTVKRFTELCRLVTKHAEGS